MNMEVLETVMPPWLRGRPPRSRRRYEKYLLRCCQSSSHLLGRYLHLRHFCTIPAPPTMKYLMVSLDCRVLNTPHFFLSIYLFFVSLSLLFLSLRGIKSVAIKWKQCGKYTRHEASPHPYSIAYRIYLINKVPRESCTGSCCGWNFIPTVLRVVDVVSDPWWNLFLFKAPDK